MSDKILEPTYVDADLGSIRSKLPKSLQDILNDRALIEGEKAVQYDDLFGTFQSSLKPSDALEWIWVKDAVDGIWEARRLRRLRAAQLDKSLLDAMVGVIEEIVALGTNTYVRDYWREHAEKLVKGWYEGDPEAVQEVERLLKIYGRSEDQIMSEALRLRLNEVDRLDKLIDAADRRRNRALRELFTYREFHAPSGLMAL